MKSIIKSLVFNSILLLIFSNSVLSQASFEAGYIINEDLTKTTCLIKNRDWKYNPTEVEYKLDSNSIVKSAPIESIHEFSINGVSKYEKHTVIIDKMNDNERDQYVLSDYNYSEETVLLKVLVEGKAKLYLYEGPKYLRFFYSIDGSHPEQLVYKSYRRYTNGPRIEEVTGTDLEYNRLFRIQLFDNLNCESIDIETIKKVPFKKNKLSDLFHSYNICQGSQSINFDDSRNRDLFKFRIRGGIGKVDLKVPFLNSSAMQGTNTISPRISAEFEYILPFWNSRFSTLFEPTFLMINYDRPESSGSNKASFKYKAIQIGLGFRYNYNFNKKNKIYASVLYTPEQVFSSNLSFEDAGLNYRMESINNLAKDFAFSIGLVFNKVSIEARYHLERDFGVGFLVSQYNASYIIIGYEL